jgi:hypothetical protein
MNNTDRILSQAHIYFQLFFFFFGLSILNAQHIPSDERGDISFRAKNQLEANNIRTSVFNYGLTGRESGAYPFSEQTPYEWPKNSGQVYLAVTGPIIGAEVVNEQGDTIHIIEMFHYRQSPQGLTWNMEPIPGYFNVNNHKVASSDNPSTWPSFWPDRMNDLTDPGWAGSWDGYFGKNVFIDGQELYFKFSDDLYDRHSYYPDTTDLTRKGLGLIISGRAFSFNEEFLKDIVFYSYKIKNDGTKLLNKVGFTLASADYVGETGQDDILGYDLSRNFICSFDDNNLSYWEEPVGAFSISFLKFPEEGMSINNIQQRPSNEGLGDQYSEEFFWEYFLTPGSFADTSIGAGEFNQFTSTSYFSLQPGETKEIFCAVSFANGPFIDPNHSIRRNGLVGQYYAALAAMQGNFNFNAYSLNIVSPTHGQSYSNEVNISWTTVGAINRIADYLYYSTDNGDSWNFLAVDSSRTGNYTWNTQNFPDGIFFKLKIISAAENGTAIAVSDGIFKINKNNVNALPQVYIISPANNSEISGNYMVNLLSGDADGDQIVVDLFYKIDRYNQWQPLANNIQNNLYEFYSPDVPNSSNFYLKAIVRSNSDSGFYEVKHIVLNNERLIFPDSTISFRNNSPATGTFEVRVINQSQVTGDDYITEFESVDGHLVYDVIDATSGVKLIDDAVETDGISEGPYFDGLRLFIKDDELKEIDSLSGWNNSGIFPLHFSKMGTTSPAKRSDYRIEIAELGVDTSNYWVYQSTTMPAIPVNFKVFNLSENRYIEFAFRERDTIGGSGYFSRNGSYYKDAIFLLEYLEQDTLINTYLVNLDDCELCSNPQTGDIYSRYITKPFYAGDSVFFSTQRITDVDDENYHPEKFILEQNYPNPFNPITKIRFQIPSASFVQLEVYDILGRKVTTLLNKEMNAGGYVTEFDASKFASGVYIYRLKAGDFISSKKMILIK